MKIDILDFLRELIAMLDGHVWVVPGFAGLAYECERAAVCYVGFSAPLGGLVMLP